MSDLQKRLQMSRLPPMPPPNVGTNQPAGGAKRAQGRRKRDYTPVTWDSYFNNMHDVIVGTSKFRVYEAGKSGPVCLFLHGGGFSSLSWAVLSKDLVRSVTCRCAALDLRGHGDTYTDNDIELSADTLASDVGNVVQELYGEEPPPIILVGHSMGGAIAVHVAHRNLIPSLIGLAVIDVVEGTALEALNTMQTFLRSRPTMFKSVEQAIEWSIRSGHIRNLESAKVSMLGQLKKCSTNETATSEKSHEDDTSAKASATDTITEEDEEECGSSKEQQPSRTEAVFSQPQDPISKEGYTWRIDLTKTDPYWRGWFEGLSNLFLSCSVPKILLLAGVDRLDKELTTGQMQGKFQMQVLPQCGHAVHEDVPEKVADVLATFMVRHRVAEPNEGFTRTFPAC